MLWSLVKILVFVGVIVAITLGLGMLLETSGGVRVSVANTEFTFTPLMTIIGLVLLLAAFWVALKVLGLLFATFHFLNGDETAISRYFTRNRERKGYEALADGLMALASGEGRAAMAKAAKAEKYLARPELTNLLAAQAAESAGDTKKAQAVYKRLLTDERTRFVGVRGIMKQKLAEGDTETALKLAEKAFSLKPKHEETQDVLLKLQAKTEDWAGARKTLNAKLKHGNLPRDVHRRRDAVLALSEAKDVLEEGTSIEARETAIEANRLSPDLIPAAVLAARGYIEQGKPKYAARVIKKAWSARPHPDLAATFALIAPDETPQARIKRFAALTKSLPDHAETKMLLAELNIAAEQFPEARRAIGDLAEENPTARVLTIMAAVERGEGSDDAVVRGWLTRALSAPRGPQWVCQNCQNIHTTWAPTCGSCGSLDTLSWTDALQSSEPLPANTAMLPLIVGGIEGTADKPTAEDAQIVADHEVVVVELDDSTADASPAK
ncbi:heme biosynthesis HemY N-terminal domain-containing protein [uncultured Litoreibacter sp.]|uniref:heme biosynthesis protein HemY n=1 Tax=uncultured Litoreibacter sp. TaxID=1392394 RepID=UPI0026156812|nr:heme biosynthesis HemY N-terminal domain-containing protein [uncultured Litoreibacter sp.]